jgi:hypothetical protein
MAAECQEVRSQLEMAQQQLARRETVLTRQFLPVLKGMGEFAPEDRLAYLEKFMHENDLLVIKYANAKKDTQELLVFGKALWMLSQAFRDMADADRRRSAEHAVTGVVEQEDDSRRE